MSNELIDGKTQGHLLLRAKHNEHVTAPCHLWFADVPPLVSHLDFCEACGSTSFFVGGEAGQAAHVNIEK